MPAEILLCIPGPWTDRADFLRRTMMFDTPGRYMYAAGMFADVHAKDHIKLDLCDADPQMDDAFSIAGQGHIDDSLLAEIGAHRSVVYLHFPADALDQRERILKYTQILQRLGGIAIKVESAGTAHGWDRWFKLMSGDTFQQYCALCVLVGGSETHVSFGMHHFGKPDSEVPSSIEINAAADLMNRFNMYQIVENPNLGSGHTFSLAADAPVYRLTHRVDDRYPDDSPFHNPNGLWNIVPV